MGADASPKGIALDIEDLTAVVSMMAGLEGVMKGPAALSVDLPTTVWSDGTPIGTLDYEDGKLVFQAEVP
jgi:hypothetical protein